MTERCVKLIAPKLNHILTTFPLSSYMRLYKLLFHFILCGKKSGLGSIILQILSSGDGSKQYGIKFIITKHVD